MSIASEITRLQGVKSDILQAIEDKGVTVPAGAVLDDCPELIGQIEQGGGGAEPFPDGSVPIGGIYTKGNSYIDITSPTNLPINSVMVEVTFRPCQNSMTNQGVISLREDFSSSPFRFISAGADSYCNVKAGYASWGGSPSYSPDRKIKTMKFGYDSVSEKIKFDTYQDGELVATISGGSYIGQNPLNCIRILKGAPNYDSTASNIEIFGVKIKVGDSLVYDLRPAKKNGTAGLYDVVGNAFYSDSSGNNNIFALPAIKTPPIDELPTVEILGKTYHYTQIGRYLWTCENLAYDDQEFTHDTSYVNDKTIKRCLTYATFENAGYLYSEAAAAYINDLLTDGWALPTSDQLSGLNAGSSSFRGIFSSVAKYLQPLDLKTWDSTAEIPNGAFKFDALACGEWYYGNFQKIGQRASFVGYVPPSLSGTKYSYYMDYDNEYLTNQSGQVGAGECRNIRLCKAI